MTTEVCTNIPRKDIRPPAAVATKLRKVHINKFDTSSMQWNCWREQFELQMLVNEVDENYWVKLASYNLDDHAYNAYEHCSGMVTGNQNINWNDFAQLM